MLSHLAYMMIKILTIVTLAITVWPFRGWRHNPPQPSGDWIHCRKGQHRFCPEIKREDFPRPHLYFTIRATLRTKVYELRSSTATDRQTIIYCTYPHEMIETWSSTEVWSGLGLTCWMARAEKMDREMHTHSSRKHSTSRRPLNPSTKL